jgi:Ser/Thr protein kinase RdoA (MazF antagonist)
METGTFDLLAPNVVIAAVEDALGLELDGTMTVYPSYVNRVYGLRDTDGEDFIAKFYRPGRWSEAAIVEEHEFVADCAAIDVPVVAPFVSEDGGSISSVVAEADEETSAEARGDQDEREQEFLFALYPKRGGRSFDAESDEDWIRLGSVAGRIHAASRTRRAEHRLVCTPEGSTARFLEELRGDGVVHPDVADEFFDTSQRALEWFGPLFDGVELQRIHGDFHRGNILDRPGEGLLVVDFDDMMMGPAVQDLWLLLPDRGQEARRELNLILEGYEQFESFDPSSLRLIEPLRLMRMLYYVAWSSRQRHDHRFQKDFPGWGGKAFWEKELEDVRTQIAVIRDALEGDEDEV